MIFVTVGSSTIPFDRLLQAIGELPLDDQCIVQYGASHVRPQRAECLEFVEYEAFLELVQKARVTITHGGVGSIMTTLAVGRRPIVVPRRRSLGEAVDDHQVAFARRAASLGLVTIVEDVALLRAAIGECRDTMRLSDTAASPIELELRAYIEECVRPTRSMANYEGSVG